MLGFEFQSVSVQPVLSEITGRSLPKSFVRDYEGLIIVFTTTFLTKRCMDRNSESEITQILQEWNRGELSAGERLFPVVYNELKRQARFLMAGERHDHTLQPTALVHEAFLKLTGLNEIKWNDRGHFFRFVSQIMRQILVDHARVKAAAKRGKNAIHFSIDELKIPVGERAAAIVSLDEALNQLAAIDARRAKIVEMKYFGGMSVDEIAESLEISVRTVGREWREAKFWLYRELNKD